MTRMSSTFWKNIGCTPSLLRLNGPAALPTERKKRTRGGACRDKVATICRLRDRLRNNSNKPEPATDEKETQRSPRNNKKLLVTQELIEQRQQETSEQKMCTFCQKAQGRTRIKESTPRSRRDDEALYKRPICPSLLNKLPLLTKMPAVCSFKGI